MIRTRGTAAALLFGLAMLGAGLVLILARDWVWAQFTQFYGLLGIAAERRRMWDMFITTIGLGLSLAGLVVLWAAMMRVRNERRS